MKMRTGIVLRALVGASVLCSLLALTTQHARAETIIDEWSRVTVPPAPTLQALTVDPKSTALLILDLVKQTCNAQVRPRCLASLPNVARLIKAARDNKATVIYSLIPGPDTPADILPAVAMLGSEPLVKSGPDKFIGTDLEKMLKADGIQTVVVVGTAAHGAVLYTASHAALLGFNVIIPVDGMSAENTYAEQYVAWNMTHAPVVSAKVKLTAIDMLKF
jgi:nicotinamidase-related amidase